MQSTPQDATGPNTPLYSADALFARRLKEVRSIAGLTQQQLADRVTAAGHKLFRSQVGKIESGDRLVTLGEADALADALGVELADLISPHVMDAHLLYMRERFVAQTELRSSAEDMRRHLMAAREHQILAEDAKQRNNAARQLLTDLLSREDDE